MALKEEEFLTCRSQLKELTLAEVKAMRRTLLPKIKKLKRNPRCHSPQLKALQKQNLMLKDEIASRRITAEKAARPSAEIIALPSVTLAQPAVIVEQPLLAATG